MKTLKERLNIWPTVRRVARFILVDHVGLVAVLAIGLYVRLWLLQWWQSPSVGDVFNFVQIAESLGRFDVPIGEKRLPFYPFLILLGHLITPSTAWEWVAITVALMASLAVLAALYFTGLRLRLNRLPVISALLMYAAFFPFLAYSIRGYADTTLTALVTAGVLATLWLPKKTALITLGLLLGAMTLTRHEGLIVAAVLWLLAAWRLRQSWQKIVVVTALAGAVLLPYGALIWQTTDSIWPSEYLAVADESQVYGALSIKETWENFNHIWERSGLYDIYTRPKILRGELRDDTLGFHKHVLNLVGLPVQAAGLLAALGLIFLILRRPLLDGLTILLPFLALSVPIAWWAPSYIRLDGMRWPLMALLVMAGLHALWQVVKHATHEGGWGKLARLSFAGILILTSIFVWLDASLADTRDHLQKSRLREYAWYQAVHTARDLPGSIAFDWKNLMIRFYLGDRAVFGDDQFTGELSNADAWRKLEDLEVKYVVSSLRLSDPLSFVHNSDPPTGITVNKISEYEVEPGDHEINRATIYKIVFPSE